MDGANMNAMVGLMSSGRFWTGCLPSEPTQNILYSTWRRRSRYGSHRSQRSSHSVPPDTIQLYARGWERKVSERFQASPWGSPSILPISWAYIAMMGDEGLKRASESGYSKCQLYREAVWNRIIRSSIKGSRGFVAHECIVDLRGIKSVNRRVGVVDIAKRLMDYGFHAPTVSWPVNETMMIEPTESESKQELDRFCEALVSIPPRDFAEIESGQADRSDNVLKNAPHTAVPRLRNRSDWTHDYTREKAAFPASWTTRK